MPSDEILIAPEWEADGARVQALSDWLVQQGLRGSPLEDVLEGFCKGLCGLGIPLWRCFISMRTLHPSFTSISFRWRIDEGVVREAIAYSLLETDDWIQSPFHHMLETDSYTLRRSLAGPDAVIDFPVLGTFRDQGATDYVARILPFGDEGVIDGRTGLAISWATTRAGGFFDVEIAVMDRLLARLALTVKTILGTEITRNVADTYIGRDAGTRILRGEIRRGVVDVIHAVVFFADLRGFTALTDTLPRDELVPMLDDYLDCMASPIVSHGGEVLKYLGDGLLATFDLSATGRDSICRVSLDAAVEALQWTETLNTARRAEGKPTTQLDIALHLGDVLYGNVGAKDRLDFTVIGPAVNEASRIESLCDSLDRHLLVSESFARAATQCTRRLVSVGWHRLRGIDRAQEIFSLNLPEAVA
ncbi:MAG: adenylate/guanylate cyclase domain-containing protein [Alphaproteobacteria bacterium]